MEIPLHLLRDFDPNLAKVAELRGILLEHDVPYSSIAKKADLVRIYETQLRPRVPALLAQRRAVKPSAHGIIDANNGNLIAPDASPLPKLTKTGGRRGKAVIVPDTDGEEEDLLDQGRVNAYGGAARGGNSSKAPTVVAAARRGALTKKASASTRTKVPLDPNAMEVDPIDLPVKLVPIKKAAKSTKAVDVKPKARARKGAASIEPKVEEEDVKPLVNKRSRAKPRPNPAAVEAFRDAMDVDVKAEVVSPKKPGHSVLSESREKRRESGFSDYNPFQSGSGDDDEEPQGQPRLKRRKSIAPPAEERVLDDRLSPRKSMPSLRTKDVYSSTNSVMPEQVGDRDVLKPSKSKTRQSIGGYPPSASPFISRMAPVESLKTPSAEFRQLHRHGLPTPPESFTQDVDHSSPNGRSSEPGPGTLTVARRGLGKVARSTGNGLVTAVNAAVWPAILLTLLTTLAWGSWYRDGILSQGYCPSAPYSDLTTQSLPGAINAPTNQLFDQVNSGPQPTCLDCPPHGVCRAGQLTCADDYVPRGGLGLVWPVAERCEPDPERAVREVKLAMKILKQLQAKRAAAECATLSSVKQSCFNLGLPEDTFRDQLWEQDEQKMTREAWDRVYNKAVEIYLKPENEVGQCIDSNGRQWIMASKGDLPISCRMKKASYNFANHHKGQLSGLMSALGFILYLRSALAKRQAENEIVRDLVGESLLILQAEHQFAPAQLCDLVLQDEHSASKRRRLWSKVAPIVEGNANVRTGQAERRGETLKVWEWVGVNTPQRRASLRKSGRLSLIEPPSA